MEQTQLLSEHRHNLESHVSHREGFRAFPKPGPREQEPWRGWALGDSRSRRSGRNRTGGNRIRSGGGSRSRRSGGGGSEGVGGGRSWRPKGDGSGSMEWGHGGRWHVALFWKRTQRRGDNMLCWVCNMGSLKHSMLRWSKDPAPRAACAQCYVSIMKNLVRTRTPQL